ncbi:MAG: arginine--tRNA ligase [Deltaproteobacteria bacterium]|nr:arginine--tRNA ligase [Deltaproteobacteria bacterium]
MGVSEPIVTIPEFLHNLVCDASTAAGFDNSLVEPELAQPTQNPKFGDYQSNHAFRLGRALKTNPRAVAETICSQLGDHPSIVATSVAGPGFINFTLDDGFLADQLVRQVEDPNRAIAQVGSGQTVVIDYSGPNVAKRMHVGHMRSTIIGNTIDRLHRASGWTVVADNHIGDWGTQFGKLIVAWRLWLDEDAFAADSIGELERLYVKFGNEADEAMQDQARAETVKLQAGDAENFGLWKQFIEVSLAEFERVYARLNVSFDEVLGESFYNDSLAGVVNELCDRGIAEESEGARVIRWDEDAPKGLRETVLVIQKSDGAFLYGTTDLATLKHRKDTWDPNRVIYVTDTRQQLHFRQVMDAWNRWEPEHGMDLVHTWFGMLVLPEGAMSTRKGNVIRLLDLLDEAVRRARTIVDEKSPDLSDEERAEVAESVGAGALRYADLSQNPQSNVTFDWDRMLSMEGNTAPYLMYSYARCRSIQRKAGAAGQVDGLVLEGPFERALAMHLLRFGDAVASATNAYRPNLLCDYLYETANIFNRFYREVPVLKADTDAQRISRLALVESTARILGHGFDMLGIRPLDRM